MKIKDHVIDHVNLFSGKQHFAKCKKCHQQTIMAVAGLLECLSVPCLFF